MQFNLSLHGRRRDNQHKFRDKKAGSSCLFSFVENLWYCYACGRLRVPKSSNWRTKTRMNPWILSESVMETDSSFCSALISLLFQKNTEISRDFGIMQELCCICDNESQAYVSNPLSIFYICLFWEYILAINHLFAYAPGMKTCFGSEA